MDKHRLLYFLLLVLSTNSFAADWLFRGGKSNYQIVVSAEASSSEQTAARELQQYIQQVSGVELPITADLKTSGRHIYVGYNERVASLSGAQKPEKDDESFSYRTVGHDLLIWGGLQRGTMYGVFTFLERELGIHWLTPKCTIVPERKEWKLPRLNRTERPFIGYRYSNYFVARDVPEWSAHTRENTNGILRLTTMVTSKRTMVHTLWSGWFRSRSSSPHILNTSACATANATMVTDNFVSRTPMC